MFLVWIVRCAACMVGVHYFMMDADLYNNFLLRLRIKRSEQPSVCISLSCYILVQFAMSS